MAASPWRDIEYPLTLRDLGRLSLFKDNLRALEFVTDQPAAIDGMTDQQVKQFARRLVFARMLVKTGRIHDNG
jgi:hypothetical protein